MGLQASHELPYVLQTVCSLPVTTKQPVVLCLHAPFSKLNSPSACQV